jgi:hypothetical protein
MLIGSNQYVLNLFLNINLIDLVSIIPNPTNQITFFFITNMRHLSHTSKEIYSLIRRKKT